MVEESRSDRAVGYGLVGLAIGLVLFAVSYTATTRANVASPTDGAWLFVFMLLLLAPAVIAALVGATRAEHDASRPPH